jgi:hypothetical protein
LQTSSQISNGKQFGFRSRHSTVDALLSIQKIALESVNARKKCSIVSLDLCKAYDTVYHKLLILKLVMNGLDDIALNWFHSYPNRRKQFVKFNIVSSELPLSMSIPQGTILGPVLFSIFINDITELELMGILFLYADDGTIVICGKDFNELENNILHDLNLIRNWLKNNKLLLNIKKSSYMIINLNHRNIQDMNISIDGQLLTRVNVVKILGIYFDDRICFDHHIGKTSSKVLQRIGVLSRLK